MVLSGVLALSAANREVTLYHQMLCIGRELSTLRASKTRWRSIFVRPRDLIGLVVPPPSHDPDQSCGRYEASVGKSKSFSFACALRD